MTACELQRYEITPNTEGEPLPRHDGALFAEVNVIEDPDTRTRVYATKADAIVEAYALPGK